MRRLRQIGPGLFIATGDLYTTNTTVVAGAGGGCLVVDPGVTVADLESLIADLGELNLTPTTGFATHPHWDHVLWHAGLGRVPRYATRAAAAVAERDRDALIEAVKDTAPGHDLDLFARLTRLDDANDLPWPGPRAMVVAHSGHAQGHAALFLPDSGVLIAGDMCSDIEIPLLDMDAEDPVGDYRQGLERLAALAVRLVIPGHGSVATAAGFRDRVAADLRYLDELGGGGAGDRRITSEWLAAEHQAQIALIRSPHRAGGI